MMLTFALLAQGRQLSLVGLANWLLDMSDFVTLKACALARVLIKPVTWSRLSKLPDNREDRHQASRSDRASLRQNLLRIIEPYLVVEIEYAARQDDEACVLLLFL